MIKYIGAISILFIMMACSSVKVMHVGDVGDVSDYMLQYFLPQNELSVTVLVQKETLKKGPYSDYAKELLGIEKVIAKDDVDYEIYDIDVSVSSKRDDSQQFMISSKGKSYIKQIYLTDDGVLKGINTPGGVSKIDQENDFAEEQNETSEFLDMSIKPFKAERIDTSYKRIRRDSVLIKQPVYTTSFSNKSVKEKAEEAAKFILKLRKRRFKLVSGMYDKFPKGGALSEMVNALNDLEQEYLELFVGKRSTSTSQSSYSFIPSKNSLESVLAYFSDKEGVLTNKAYGSVPIEINVLPKRVSEAAMRLESSYAALKTDGKLKAGLAYRNPTSAIVEVRSGSKVLYNDEVTIAQLGALGFLPVKQNEGLAIEFDESTGAIISVKIH